jgi:hypothetical protein
MFPFEKEKKKRGLVSTGVHPARWAVCWMRHRRRDAAVIPGPPPSDRTRLDARRQAVLSSTSMRTTVPARLVSVMALAVYFTYGAAHGFSTITALGGG